MKRKLLLTLVIMAFAVCLLAVGISASTIYKDENGTELFKCEIADGYHIESYQIKNGGFDKFDDDGDALTWYLVSTTEENGNVIKVVSYVKTKDVYADGKYTGVDKSKVVSANYDKGTSVVPSFGDYRSYSKEILFMYIPSEVTVLPERVGQRTPMIVCEIPEDSQISTMNILPFYEAKSLREIFIPAGITSFPFKDGKPFENCTRLERITFAENSKLTVMPGNVFYGCCSVKAVTLPNSVETIQSRVFEGMAGLEYANFGAGLKYIVKTSDNHSLFYRSPNVKTVVFPKTLLAENVDAEGKKLTYSFNECYPTFVYTGELEEFLKIQQIFASANDNNGIKGATVENGRIIIADHCETFFGGHAWKGENSIIGNNYFKEINIGDACANCGASQVKSTIAPIFEWKGYSKSTFGDTYSVVQGFYVNREALNDYSVYAPDFDFGIMATGNASGEAIKPQIGADKVFTAIFDNTVTNYYDVKVTGITEAQKALNIIFCIYVLDGGKMYYLDGGNTAEDVIGISHENI